MTPHILFLLLSGLALLGMFFLPRLLKDRLLSIPIVYVIFGFLIFKLPLDALPIINPQHDKWDSALMEYISEFIVIISLAAVGIKIDRRPSLANWDTGLYLLGIAMPLCIAAVAGLGWWLMGLAPATALLLGAVLAPTDPVLAGNVQVAPPNEGGEDHVRFGLTLEAGLNDGLAFPFVYLALGLATASTLSDTLLTWAWWDVGYRIVVGVGMGLLIGWLLPRIFFRNLDQMGRREATDFKEGIFIIGAVLVTYTLTEVVEGYGFLAVFVAAVMGRHQDRDHKLHQHTYQSIDQVEQAVLSIFLIGFGGMLATGILDRLTWQGAAVGLALLLLVRPLTGLLSFTTCRLSFPQKLALSFFGIRGVGSIYYLAYAHNADYFPRIGEVWATVSFTILASILLHGITAGPVLAWVDRSRPVPAEPA